MKRVSTDPELFGRVINGLLGPVTSVGYDNGEAVDLAILILVRNGGERMPFEEGLGRNFEAVEGLHRPVLEVKAGSMIGEDFGVDLVMAEAGPGDDCAASRNDEKPKVGRDR